MFIKLKKEEKIFGSISQLAIEGVIGLFNQHFYMMPHFRYHSIQLTGDHLVFDMPLLIGLCTSLTQIGQIKVAISIWRFQSSWANDRTIRHFAEKWHGEGTQQE